MEQLPIDVGGGVGDLELPGRGGGSGGSGGSGHAGLAANVRSSAAWKSVTSSSICSSVTTNGGAIITRSPFSPSACPTLGQTTRPAKRGARGREIGRAHV